VKERWHSPCSRSRGKTHWGRWSAGAWVWPKNLRAELRKICGESSKNCIEVLVVKPCTFPSSAV